MRKKRLLQTKVCEKCQHRYKTKTETQRFCSLLCSNRRPRNGKKNGKTPPESSFTEQDVLDAINAVAPKEVVENDRPRQLYFEEATSRLAPLAELLTDYAEGLHNVQKRVDAMGQEAVWPPNDIVRLQASVEVLRDDLSTTNTLVLQALQRLHYLETELNVRPAKR